MKIRFEVGVEVLDGDENLVGRFLYLSGRNSLGAAQNAALREVQKYLGSKHIAWKRLGAHIVTEYTGARAVLPQSFGRLVTVSEFVNRA